jgi:hypothetical protein
MTDDGGVLGNLPRSRPGRRSEKRADAPAPPPPADARKAPDPPPDDPLADAIRTATGVAAAGARLANGLAREALRRLPRP